MQQIVYLVGKVNLDTNDAWECCGVFDTKEQAESYCTTDQHFVGPLAMNEWIDLTGPWPGAWYPKLYSAV